MNQNKQEDQFRMWLKEQIQNSVTVTDIYALGNQCYQKGYKDALLYMISFQINGKSNEER